MKEDLDATSLILVDEMENAVGQAYGGLPNSAYVVGQDGLVYHKQPWMDAKILREPLESLLASGGRGGENPPEFPTGVVRPGGGRGPAQPSKPVATYKDAPVKVPQGAEEEIIWNDDLAQAQKQAKEAAVPVFVELYFDACSVCEAMAKGPLKDPKVVGLTRKFVCVKMDLLDDDVEALAKDLEFVGSPAFAVYNPDGKVVLKHVNYAEADFIVDFLKQGLQLSSQADDRK